MSFPVFHEAESKRFCLLQDSLPLLSSNFLKHIHQRCFHHKLLQLKRFLLYHHSENENLRLAFHHDFDTFSETLEAAPAAAKHKSDVLFVCFFSTHGDLSNKQSYLFLKDSDAIDKKSLIFIYKELMNAIAKSGVLKAIVLIDACHAGARDSFRTYELKRIEDQTRPKLRNRGLLFGTGSQKKEEAHDRKSSAGPKHAHSHFTTDILTALHFAENNQWKLTVDTLYKLLKLIHKGNNETNQNCSQNVHHPLPTPFIERLQCGI